MNITFLIGNGFDRNLGLKTTYADFIKYYKTTKTSSKVLGKFREHINDNEELWKNAETALGLYTQDFEVGEGMAFSECHQDLCEKLVEYLKEQESHLFYEDLSEKILNTFKSIIYPESPFPTQERNNIRAVFNKFEYQQHIFNFICFNYTSTLDNCLNIVKNTAGTLGQHKHGNTILTHILGQLHHVHGTVEKEIVFAVNDESQIAKPEIFDFEDGEICKHFLIKQQANESYQENTDSKANEILQNSTIIYIYGMSLGETDKLWWNRICKWLSGSNDRHLIIQNYDMPVKGVYALPYQLAEKRKKKELLAYSDFDNNTKNALSNRIHITGYNIFGGISNVATEESPISNNQEESTENIIVAEEKAG